MASTSKGCHLVHTMNVLRRIMWSPVFIIFSIAISFWLGLGWVPLFDLDEGAFTEATREMMASGNYAATFLDGEPRYDKPIFFYWLQAASIQLLGFNEWAFRLPSVIMASIWAWVVFRFVQEFSHTQRAKIAALFLINGIWVALIARSAIADATLNVFLTLLMFDMWRYFYSIQHTNTATHVKNLTPKSKVEFFKYNVLTLRIYLWMALATLTKGPVAIAVPLIVSLAYLLSSRAPLASYRAYINPFGWITYIAVVSPWLYAVYLSQGSDFFEGFILEHNIKRFTDTRENHGGSLFYYFIVLPIILIPYSGLLGSVFKRSATHLQQPLTRYLLIWFTVIFVLFSLSKTQLPHYILNGCVPLIILMAIRVNLHNKNRWALWVPIAFMVLLTTIPWLLPAARESADDFSVVMLSRYHETIPPYYVLTSFACLACIIAAALLPQLRTWQRLTISGMVLNFFIFTMLVRVISGLQQAPVQHAIQFLKNRDGHETVVAFQMHMPSFSVYRQKITPLRAPEVGEIVLTRIDRTHKLQQPHTQYQQLFESGGLVLLKRQPDTH